MTEVDNLVRSLCDTPGRELVNVKFHFQPHDNVSQEQLCDHVSSVLMKVQTGKISPRDNFGDADMPTINVADFVKSRS